MNTYLLDLPCYEYLPAKLAVLWTPTCETCYQTLSYPSFSTVIRIQSNVIITNLDLSSIHLTIYISMFLCFHVSMFLYFYVSIFLCFYFSMFLYFYISIFLYVSILLVFYLSFFLSVFLCFYLFKIISFLFLCSA